VPAIASVPEAISSAAGVAERTRGLRSQRVAEWMVCLSIGVTGVLALELAWLLVWSVALCVGAFLIGPIGRPELRQLPFLGVYGPPTLATIVTAFLYASQRSKLRAAVMSRSLSPSRPDAGEPIGRVIALGLLGVGCLGFLAYARLVFVYHRVQPVDEGLYLYAGRLAVAGSLPYRDFYFDQAPLIPYALGLALAPFAYGGVAARLFAIACTLATLLVTFAAARRLGGR